jgi:hypothetical protein
LIKILTNLKLEIRRETALYEESEACFRRRLWDICMCFVEEKESDFKKD